VPRANFKGGLKFKKAKSVAAGIATQTISDQALLLGMAADLFTKTEMLEADKVLKTQKFTKSGGKPISEFRAGQLAWRSKAKISGRKLAQGLTMLGLTEIVTPYMASLGAGLGGKGGRPPVPVVPGNRSKFSPRMFSRIGRMAGLGGLGGMGATMMMVARFLGPLGFALIGAALAFGAAIKAVSHALTSATDYIRKTHMDGQFGNFISQLDNFRTVWRAMWVEFGLAIIQIADLDGLLKSIVPVFAGFVNVFKSLGESKMLKFLWSVTPIGSTLGSSKWWKSGLDAMDMLGIIDKEKLAITGNERVTSSGFSAQMAPAALQGTVEASRIINQAGMQYAASTAHNTRRTAETLQQMLNRGQQLGVVGA